MSLSKPLLLHSLGIEPTDCCKLLTGRLRPVAHQDLVFRHIRKLQSLTWNWSSSWALAPDYMSKCNLSFVVDSELDHVVKAIES